MFDRSFIRRRWTGYWGLVGGIIVLGLAVVLFAGCTRSYSRSQPVSIPNASGSALTPAGSDPSFAKLPSLTPALKPAAGSISAPVDLQPACLVGSWKVTDLGRAVERSYEQSGAALQLQDVQGQALYAFDAQGTMTLTFQRLAATFQGQIDGRDMLVEQAIDGSGSAHYQVDLVSRQLAMSNFGGEGVLFTLDINGQRLAEGNLPVWKAFTSSLQGQEPSSSDQVEHARAAVTCQENRMTIQAVEPLPGPAVELERVP